MTATPQDRDIKDLQERVRALEQQLLQNKDTSNTSSPDTVHQFRQIESRVERSARLGRYDQKEEFGEILAQLEGTLAKDRLVDSKTLSVCHSFE